MKVLKFLVHSTPNLLAENIVNYLIDAGHRVVISDLDEVSNLEWQTKYKHNLHILDKNSLNLQKIDYTIDLHNTLHVTENSAPKISFALQVVEDKFYVAAAMLECKKHSAVIGLKKLSYLSELLPCDLQYLVNEVTEVFIDAIIYLLRSGSGELIIKNTVCSEGLAFDLVKHILMLERLNNRYKSIEDDNSVFLIENLVIINDKDAGYLEHKLILPTKLSSADLEILTLYLLTLINSRQKGVYGYDLYFPKLGSSSQNNKLSKFINVELSDSYNKLLSEFQDNLYSITDNDFCSGFVLQNSRIKPQVLIAYDSEYVDDTYMLLLEYNSHIGTLTIKYKKSLYFFNDAKEHIYNFFHEFTGFRATNMTFFELLSFSQSNFNSDIITKYHTTQDYSNNQTIHHLFEIQVEQTPDKIAVVHDNTGLSYGEFNKRSNQLANYILQTYNIKPDTLIAIFLDKSEYMLIVMLGILKAGGAYVPIDPNYPDDRIKSMLEDTKLVISCERYQERLNSITSTGSTGLSQGDDLVNRINILPIDSLVLRQQLSLQLDTNPQILITSDNLVYVIYTSGTTGLPKGVMITHQGIVNLALMESQELKLTGTSNSINCLVYSNYIFDAHVWEIYAPIINGHTIHMINDDIRHDLLLLNSYIKAHHVAIATIPPALLNNQDFLSLDTMVVMGDKTIPEILVQYSNNKVKLINAYGPTEITVCATLKHYDNNLATNIGFSLGNIKCYVLDNNLIPLPIGVIGELYISGVGVARGYFNKPDITAEKFIANPFRTEEERKLSNSLILYKTGDLVRRMPKGDLEYIGRNDFQVKIRGYRIELEEIENALMSYTQIKQAVVIAKERIFENRLLINDKYLVAYYVSNNKLDENQVMSYLKSKLPEYMLPVALVHLDKLPLTINGKLDQKALPDPKFTDSYSYVKPRNALENKVCIIWESVLGLPDYKIGVHDDFFVLGGDSVAAIHLVSKLNNEFNSDIKITDIFNLKTIEKVSNVIRDTVGNFVYKDYIISQINNDDLFDPFPLTNVQQAYYLGRFSDFELGNISTHVYGEYKFRYLNTKALEQSFNQLMQRHFALRTKFTNNQQQYLKEYPRYKIEIHELSSEVEIINIRNALSHKVYDPEHYPLFDIVVSKCEDNYILHISFDALIIDMSSFQLLSEEWTKLYNNPNIILPTLEISYRDYILKYDNIRDSVLYHDAKKYWINKIDDYDFSVGLPLITDPSNIKQPKFARVSRVIKHEIWNKVLDKAQQIGISPTALILEIYGKVLAYWSNQNKICINLTLFNRLPLHQQINNIVGDFTVLELFNYTDNDHKVVSQVLQNTHNQLWSDIKHNLFDGIDVQRLAKNQRSIPTNKIIAPIVLTSIIGGSNRNHLKHNAFELPIDDSYQGLCYSITQTSQVWLDNKAYENDVGMVAEWDYVEQLFSLDVIQGMHDLYCDLIEDLAELDWDVEYFDTAMISKKDQKLIIEHINIDEQVFEINTLYGRYESCARDSSINNKIAVIDSGTDKAYSYKQLLEDTELLAKYIFAKQDLCNKNNFITQSSNLHGKLIGILSEKGYNHVVGTLSIMKSGHGYLPLNMGWPLGRLEEILNKANVSTLLISRAIYNQPRIKKFLASRYQLLVIEDILFLTHIDNALVSQLKQIVLPQVKTDDIAYVIFTSGSTGEPKGVTISHKGALNTIDAVNNKFNITARDSILALSELSFDLSVYDIFGVLAVGGTIIFPTQDKIQHSAHWLYLINKYRITIWDTVPQLAVLLLEEVSHNHIEIGVLRLFLLSGDWIPTNLPETIRRYCNDTTIVSLGGATEGSIWSIWYEIQAVDKQWSSIPYGVAMPNQKIYVLNYKDEYCPPEVTGDIYIGGIGVALNYWEDEVLTSHSFIEHKVFGRLYKTGDLGRYNRNGYIEFIGRKDSQVKLNGYRVELSEISAKLVKLQGVKDAIVKIQRENCRDYIIAYLLTTNHYQEQCKNIESTPNSLKQLINQELSKVLPDYMIPYGYVIIEKLPISANGKLEISKLPAFQIKDSNIYLAPRDELESKICQIWSLLLGIKEDKIGVEDNFFQLGGNSINAIRFVSKINREFNRNISVDIIFRQNTVAKLVQYLKYDITKCNTIDKAFVSKPEKQLLSYAQERLWFIEKYEEGTNAYNLPIISKLAIDVKLDVLKHAIRNVIKRHEILRTVIREDNGGNSYQLVLNEEELQLEIKDVVVHDKAELDYALGKLVNHVYDLSTELPITACIYKLCSTSTDAPKDSIIIEYYLGIVVHHIAFDGWSLDIFLNDLQVYYSYFLKQSNGLDVILDLPELTVQYKDFALWQRHYLSGEMLESQIVYWKNKLHDYEPLNLISDKSRPHQTDYAGADSYFTLDADISRGLRELAKELKVSLYSVLLAGYYLMLRVYSSQDDIVIGTPVANRHYNQIDNLIGFFVNSLALRMKVDTQISVKQFIQTVSQEVINAQLYQDLPFEKLVEVLKVPKDTSRHPIFQVMFGVHDFGNGIYQEQYRSTKLPLHDILTPYVPKESLLRIAQFDISTFIDDSGAILHGSFNYAVNIYTEATIKKFIETYTMILTQMSSMLGSVEGLKYTKISDLQYINKDQYQEIINIWNETSVEYPIDQTIQSVFELQVQQTPNAIAMLYNGAYLTYDQLNIKANRLAHYLRQKNNISPDTLIALFLDRSEYMLIAILSVLKAGGAYVPIDPTYPDDRIRYILEDTGTKLVLTHEVHKQRLENCIREINATDKDNRYYNASNRPTDVISLDNVTMDAQLLLQSTTNPGFIAQSTDLAYVIYTSGTTGVPKGVMLEHRGIINLKYDLTTRYKLGDKNEQEFILLFANYVFDTSVEQIILSLLNGYTLVLIPHQLWGNKEEFYNYLNTNKVTHIEASPTFLQQYDCNRILNLQRLICGGEQLNKQFYDNIQLTRNTVMVNSYGPTEASITSVVNIIQDDTDMSIGMPIANTQCYVLDNQLRPVPVGVSGELYIGGVGLARGYLNRPDLTSEKFIANPFLKHGQESCMQYSRLYKTGDVVRWLPTGKLDYIGRNDFQVKIRGYRIELQEIENVLSSYVGVSQSVVLVKHYETNVGMTINAESKYLVGYYVSNEVLDEKEITGYLQTKLPDYMVPAVFVHLNYLPLTINGKLDRKALPDPILMETEDYVAPRDEMEYGICRIWSEVLGVSVDQISITDDFFRLGGDSIISIQLVSRLRQKLDLKVNVKDIFEYKTISKLYDNVLSKNSFDTTGMLVQNEQGILTGELPLLPIQEWFFKSNFRMENHWNQSFILKTPELDLDKLRLSFAMLIDYHDNFRLRYNKCNNGSEICTQYYDKNAQPEELKILDIKDFGAEESSKAFDVCMQSMLTKWQSNFNLEHGPTYCIGYIHGYKDGTARIYFALHHLIVDTVSWRILIEDLYTLYTDGKLHSKGTSYRQWANVLGRYYINGECVAIQEKQYWHSILSDYENSIFKSPIINEKKNSSDHFSINLSSDQTVQLLRETNRAYNTEINDILLTSLAYVLFEITGQKFNHIILEGHGREEIETGVNISRTVGWFTIIYPVRLELDHDIASSIKSTKENLKKIPNKGIGYGLLIGYEPSNLPKISFNYLGQLGNVGTVNTKNDWHIVNESTGIFIHPLNIDSNVIDINCAIISGQFQFNVTSKLGKKITKQIAELFIQKLDEIIEHTTHQTRNYLTVSDIDNIISAKYLDKLQELRDIDGVYLCNSLQQGLIYHYLNQGEVDDAYRSQLIWKYNTLLDVNKLKEAWVYAQKRFDSLRLRFAWTDELVQIIDKEGSLNWIYIDSSGEKDVATQKLKIDQIIDKDRVEMYDLELGSLFRIYIIKQSEDLYTCILSNHHIILDGWSNSVLLDYVHKTYSKLLNKESISLPVDNSYQLSQKYIQQNQTEHKDYWNQYIAQILEKGDLRGLLSPESKFAQVRIEEYKHVKDTKIELCIIKDDVYQKLKMLCKEESITLNAILQYVWHKSLSIFGNSLQTVVGTTVSGRNLPVNNIENAVGLYINTLPLIVDHQNYADIGIIEAIKTIQDHINEINTRSNINLAELHESGERLFDNLFVYENYPSTLNEKESARLNISFESWRDTLDYPMAVIAYELDNQITFKLQYAGEIFDQSMIQNLLSVTQKLLEQISDKPKKKVRELCYLNEQQYSQITTLWNKSTKNPPNNGLIHELFEAQAEMFPERVVVVYGEMQLTYKELDDRANNLANYMREFYEITPDTIVTLCLDKSEYMLIAVLSVLKAGGAYVAIDPSYPDDRINYILKDTSTTIILTNEKYHQRLQSIINPDIGLTTTKSTIQSKIISIDNAMVLEQLSMQVATKPKIMTTSDHLAYVIYTSGTTGNPKGVMQVHGNIIRLFTATKNSYNFTNDDIWTLFHSYVFDFSVWEIWGALIYGGKLVIASYEQTRDFNMFYELCKKQRVTVLNQTPSVFYQFSDLVTSGDAYYRLTSLKYVIFGGETLNVSQLKCWFNSYGYSKPELMNMYGITETTVHVTQKPIREGDLNQNSYIGRSISDLQAYVLDRNLKLLPVGATGELYVGGAGLARGYLNRPDLTAEKFIANPFYAGDANGSDKNFRLYKTGDLVRLLASGELEYVGRNDSQVKIRGYRIELGEIENVILSYQGIKQTTVLAKNHTSAGEGGLVSNKYLVCYYVSENKLNEEEILCYMRSKLPEYMIPSTIIHLNSLPLTINGKLDIFALPEFQFGNVEMSYIAPSNDIEKEMCHIWSEVLKADAEKISVNNDFFRLGGDSILAIKLASKINTALNSKINIASIFKHRTVKQLSIYLQNNTQHSQNSTYYEF